MVYVYGKNKKLLMPCSEKRARQLLEKGRARIHKMVPFTIRLVDRIDGEIQDTDMKLDPGSKKTGIAVLRGNVVLVLAELEHRGKAISESLKQKKIYRRRRRSANLRYRAPRFHNRKRKEGWLPPSLQHRVDSTVGIVKKFCKLIPISTISMELVRFDTQKMLNPDISGIEYQHGTLDGYEIREYVFEKLGRVCIYCNTKKGPFNLDHIVPRANGGSNRVSNLVPSCIPCNQKKGSQPLQTFLKNDVKRLNRILKQVKTPLKDATAVNATRWALFTELQKIGVPVSTGTGGRTKWNRFRFHIDKSHAHDAVCVGNMNHISFIQNLKQPILEIKSMGRGQHQRTLVTDCGFPRGYLMKNKFVRNFATGDIVTVIVPKGKKKGTYYGRVAVRKSGSFDIQTKNAKITGISWKYCHLIQRGDGYRYQYA